MAASHALGYQSPSSIGRTVDRVFEDAQFTGEIYLNGRKLRDYPKLCNKYDLSDTVLVNISRNRLTEVPHEVCEYLHVEKINCYHNVIRSIPEAIQQLQNLTHLILSRNQLSVLPPALCLLSCLEVLSASNNKLISLPEEIGQLKSLMDLDVSCNEISHLPLQIGELSSLRSLNLRKNHLVELPAEICRLQLCKLDFSSNRIEKIPTVFRKIETLEQLILDHNPLSSPPAHISIKGRQHIIKYLQIEAFKEDRRRGILIGSDSDVKRFVRKSLPPQQSSEELKNLLGVSESKWKRHTVLNATEPGYITTEEGERNGWHGGEELKRQKAEYELKKKQAELIRVQQEEELEREKEESRQTALKLHEEQNIFTEKQEEQRRREELRFQEERRKEEEESWRREEEIKRLQETVKIEDVIGLRLAEDVHETESKLTEKNSITNNYHLHTSTSSQNYSHPQHSPSMPPTSSSSSSSRVPQPPSFLPVHGFLGPMSPSSLLSSASMSSSSSSSYQMSPQRQQEDSNFILSESGNRNVLSVQNVKEHRSLTNSTQYKRATSGSLKKPGQPVNFQQQVDNLNYANRNGVADISQQSSASTTPSVSPGPSPRNSVSYLAKPISPGGPTSQITKISSASGSVSHLAKPIGTKSAVPRATNGPTSAQSQVVRRAKLTDRSSTSSPVTAKSIKPTGAGHFTAAASILNSASSNLRRSSNSSATDEDMKPKKGLSIPVETSRHKSRLEEQNKKGTTQISALKKFGQQEVVDTNKRINTRPPANNFGSGRGRPGGPKALEDPSSNFTLRRREEQQREEAEQLDRLRQAVESRLRVTLPDNLADALRDGVVLCHLANQVRPRSVGSIHVPSPAVPKLTLAKCRRNVDNFLDACRRIGVDQEQICGPQDILDDKGVFRVAVTVAALVATGTNPRHSAV